MAISSLMIPPGRNVLMKGLPHRAGSSLVNTIISISKTWILKNIAAEDADQPIVSPAVLEAVQFVHYSLLQGCRSFQDRGLLASKTQISVSQPMASPPPTLWLEYSVQLDFHKIADGTHCRHFPVDLVATCCMWSSAYRILVYCIPDTKLNTDPKE